jgi:hypothetical protein
MELKLDERQAAVLRGVLDHYLPNLRMEIAGTENYELRQALKQDEEVIKNLLAKLDMLRKTGEPAARA